MARTNDMPEKNSSDGTLNLNMELCFNSGKKKIHAMTMKMHGYRVSPRPPSARKFFKISLGLSKVS